MTQSIRNCMFTKNCFPVHPPCIAVRARMHESLAHLMSLYPKP
jgi:hypothetical protein